MARYDYRCRTCDERFEVQRPMTAASDAAPCPDGHLDTVRVLTAFATTGAGPSRSSAGGGGCCGGACGCGAR
jgi:putative FmdB family regulatory protein